MRVWNALRIIIVFSLHRSTAVRPTADLIDLERDVPNAEPKDPNASRVAEPDASRVKEPNASHVAEPNVTLQQDNEVEEDCDRTWGDIFEETKGILLSLDFLWLGLCAFLVVGILLWMPKELRTDGVGGGFADGDLQPIAWYSVAFQSLSSHAAGLVGFAGFQKILVARILMTGDPCDGFSISDALLFVTLVLSAFAMISSFVFLYVDYMRRLAIETALQKKIQLILTPGVLHGTGLGRAILLFAGLTLFLYGLQIIKEVVWSTALQDGEETSDWYLQVLPRTAGACLSVALFYVNLHGLHRSPKVQFDSTCQAAEDKTFKTLKLEEFLRDLSDEPPSLPDWATKGLKKVGGEDLASIATHGSRQAFFPNRRRSPLVHAVFGILFLGVCPLAIQIGSQKLFFVSPRLDDLKELTGTTAEVSEKLKTSMWQTVGMSTEESTRPIREFLLLPKSSIGGHLQVAFENGQTSRVQLCCGRCQTKMLKHSLTKLPTKPMTFEFPTNVTNCSLELFGLSNGFVTKVSLIVVPKDKHNFCDCSGQRCNCCEKFQGHWDFKEWNNSTFAKLRRPLCTPINSCPDHEKITEQGACVEATCDVADSNLKPGRNCTCNDGFSGNITWKQAIPRGSCIPAECNVTHSNQLPGKKCECLHGYNGRINWNGSTALGSCEPISCVGDKLNGKLGPDCQCKDGYKGQRLLVGGIFTDIRCSLAQCDIPNSHGTGPNCKCAEHHTGTIRWEGPTAIGMCERMHCLGQNSNGLSGPDCGCKTGFKGVVTPMFREHKQVLYANCTPARCYFRGSNGISGPGCACKDGYAGSPRWNAEQKAFGGQCIEAACNIENSNLKPGLDCQCKFGYTGHISWFGPKASGECEPMPCVGENTNGLPGPDCGCTDGFTGSVVEANHTERIEDEWEEGWTDKTYEALVGDCQPVPCNVEKSNRAPGLDCKCQSGYTGQLAWVGAEVFGECTPLPCVGKNMNLAAGPQCRCLDGFRGSVRLGHVQFSGGVRLWEEVMARRSLAQTADCEPAPCDISNSNQVPGLGCRCLDGFAGLITWREDSPTGNCEPSPCWIQNSNLRDGLQCRCLDGYNGSITWEGPVPSGTCTAVPCKVLHSDFASGPDCQCLPGFYGQISWTGTQPEGECLPLPRCSEPVVHTAWLKADVTDAEDQECAAGQQLVFHGHLCEEMEGKIVWTSARAQPPGRCTWEWPVEEDCGQDSGKVPALLSQVSPPVPMECSTQPARPRCDAEVKYITTSLDASRYTCEDEADERVDTLRLFPQLVQFQGRPCGYDLIWWEAATILRDPENSTSEALPCKIKGQHHRPLECGEIPPAEQLPRGCLRTREPAVFTIEHRSDAQSAGSEHPWSAIYFVKLLDSGMSAMGRLSYSGRAISLRWCSDNAWQTDGTYILFEVTEEFQDEFNEFFFLGVRAADDKVGSRFADPSGKLRLVARNALPSWWVSKFEDATEPRDFNIDAMMGCRLSAFQNGTCYRTLIGHTVTIFKADKYLCLGGSRDVDDLAESRHKYTYMFSESGTQSYSSTTSCLPRANHHELQLEIAHVRLEAGSQPTVVAMETRCRTKLRFVVNVAKLECKGSTLRHAWNLQKVHRS